MLTSLSKPSLAITLCFAFSHQALANNSETFTSNEKVKIQQTQISDSDFNQDDYLLTEHHQFTVKDQFNASKWKLNKIQWLRYKEVMATTTASVQFPNVDPITILGAYARTEQERKIYVDLYIKEELEKQQRVAIFDNAVNQEIDRRAPSLGLFKTRTQRLQENQPPALRNLPQFKLVSSQLFIDTRLCNMECNNFATEMVKSAGNDGKLDIYFVISAQNDKLIQEMASSWGITNEHVNDYRITINHNNGQYEYARNQGYKDPLPFTLRQSSWGQSIVKP